MDEWLSSERILEPPSVAAKLAKEHASQHGHGKSADADTEGAASEPGEDEPRARRRKRQGKEATSPEDDATTPTVVGDMAHDEHEGIDEASLREHEEVTKIKNVQTIELGLYIMECWYFSPFPKEYFPHGFVERLYFCEYSLRFFAHQEELQRYQARGVDPHPPGNEIYRKDGLAMFEVDGEVSREYCQNLCYLAKLFLDHKTLYYEVDPFLFYVMCEYDERGYHPTGYFSKEKYSDVGYNLACILTFPCYQRKGYGRFLISFSYELSKKEFKVGSPEKPLSDLGAVSYRSYWSAEVLKALEDFKGPSLSIMEISKQTSILSDDVTNALQYLGLLKYLYNNYVICVPPDVLADLRRKNPIKAPIVDPVSLHWAPLIGQVRESVICWLLLRPCTLSVNGSSFVVGRLSFFVLSLLARISGQSRPSAPTTRANKPRELFFSEHIFF
jgi:histone acetyltransferase MYST1